MLFWLGCHTKNGDNAIFRKTKKTCFWDRVFASLNESDFWERHQIPFIRSDFTETNRLGKRDENLNRLCRIWHLVGYWHEVVTFLRNGNRNAENDIGSKKAGKEAPSLDGLWPPNDVRAVNWDVQRLNFKNG